MGLVVGVLMDCSCRNNVKSICYRVLSYAGFGMSAITKGILIQQLNCRLLNLDSGLDVTAFVYVCQKTSEASLAAFATSFVQNSYPNVSLEVNLATGMQCTSSVMHSGHATEHRFV